MRLHGPDPAHLYAGSYSDADLRWWNDRIGEWAGAELARTEGLLFYPSALTPAIDKLVAFLTKRGDRLTDRKGSQPSRRRTPIRHTVFRKSVSLVIAVCLSVLSSAPSSAANRSMAAS